LRLPKKQFNVIEMVVSVQSAAKSELSATGFDLFLDFFKLLGDDGLKLRINPPVLKTGKARQRNVDSRRNTKA
jgi:hypothetical protein